MPCFKYFSFSFPMVIIEIFTGYSPLFYLLSTDIIHISTCYIHILYKNISSLLHIQLHCHNIHIFFCQWNFLFFQKPALAQSHLPLHPALVLYVLNSNISSCIYLPFSILFIKKTTGVYPLWITFLLL